MLLLRRSLATAARAASAPPAPPPSAPSRYAALRAGKAKEVAALAEVQQLDKFAGELQRSACVAPSSPHTLASVGMSAGECLDALRAGMVTFALHAEARVASLLGEGFYTIGPCGEELLACIGLLLRPTDPLALHYRHVAAQAARQLAAGRSVPDMLLDRARGSVVSALDPVTGGAHCAIGGGPHDFLVTSTLASQTTPAVGRALAPGLAHHLKVPCLSPRDAVSFVSVGDGSVNNAHFLSGINLAQYAHYHSLRCPVVFAVSNNDLCISLKGGRFLVRDFVKRLLMPVFVADGRDMLDVYHHTKQAIAAARGGMRPVALVYDHLPRRFGHAATDRQAAYLSAQEIQAAADANPLGGACAQAVAAGVATYAQLQQMLGEIRAQTQTAFEIAADEPKLTSREDLNARVSRPLAGPAPTPAVLAAPSLAGIDASRLHVMRKNMNSVLDELLTERDVVYLSEDGVHGGYYMVTEGLAAKHAPRVRDFPPDETSLLGVAVGYAQMGLVPIVEIPYAKYLDCGADMFFEAVIANWLSNGRQPNGMVIRLQGFDKGVFGGNFHTHNSLHIPPGLDVVCYSNGLDYARGWRYAMRQARAGRVVMSVDSTHLLNLRHVLDRDDAWRRPYPAPGECMSFDQVTVYGEGTRLAIVAYGNAVVTALQARAVLLGEKKKPAGKAKSSKADGIVVIDSPYLSDPSKGLVEALSGVERVVFADVCKRGQHPFAGFVTSLQSQGRLPPRWQCVAAQPTYNPLGNTITFTSVADIVDACHAVLAD